MTSQVNPSATLDEKESDLTQETSFSFVQMEHDILRFWKEEQIFQLSLNQSHDRPFIFYDGPPFATGLPHHGHLVASTLKDIVPRYYTMKGYRVERRFGWDCHGLPIEQEIDKKFARSSTDIIHEHGLSFYNNECRKIVGRFTTEWEKTITRLGRWVDFKNDYKTMDTPFMESVWWVFKQLWNKNLLYQGTRVMPISTSFGTVLSNFEASSNYQSLQDPSITVLFSLAQPFHGEDCSLAVWTTTPWTLPSNLGLCVREDMNYVRVRDEQKKITFILAEERLASYNKKQQLTVLETLAGSALIGLSYKPLFSYFEPLTQDGAFHVISDSFVTATDGTGIVHLAPAFGEDDHRVMKIHYPQLMVCPIDMMGKFTHDIPELQGLYFKDADKVVIKQLKDQHQLYEQNVFVHSYPMCPRTDTPLMYRVVSSWYVNVEKIKSTMIEANKKIHWVPSHIQEGRFGKWLEGARDWAISRNRFWGTPLPVWINDQTGKMICMGSIQELEELTQTKITDLHREFVDDLTFTIPQEEGTYRRISEVLDCWFESGSMPYAQLHYPFENQELFKKAFPAQYIAEGLDQTRGWFYTLNVLSAALFEEPAFKNVIVNGLVLANDGKKMSKRLRNYTAPDELMESFGADALRLYLIHSPIVRGEELRFSDEGVKDMVRRALLPFYNAFKFFSTYAKADGWNLRDHQRPAKHVLDQWILSKLHTLTQQIHTEMQLYHLYNVVGSLFDFIEHLTNWYIRLNRRRFWGEENSEDKWQAYSTLYQTVHTLSKLLAPFTPFLSEFIYQELKIFGGPSKKSVHLESYPESSPQLIQLELESGVNYMQQVIILGRQKRVQSQIKVKIPLQKMTIVHKNPQILHALKNLEELIRGELNVKDIYYDTQESDYIHFYAKPNAPLLGKKLGKDYQKVRECIEQLTNHQLEECEQKGSITLLGYSIQAEELLFYRTSRPDKQTSSNQYISMDLDIQLTEELIHEGLARELVNNIQKTRKDLQLHVSDRIQLFYKVTTESGPLGKVFEHFKNYICGETLAISIEEKDEKSFSFLDSRSYTIDPYKIDVAIKKS
jgi:isoleucyl-tRNA synthetase